MKLADVILESLTRIEKKLDTTNARLDKLEQATNEDSFLDQEVGDLSTPSSTRYRRKSNAPIALGENEVHKLTRVRETPATLEHMVYLILKGLSHREVASQLSAKFPDDNFDDKVVSTTICKARQNGWISGGKGKGSILRITDKFYTSVVNRKPQSAKHEIRASDLQSTTVLSNNTLKMV